MKHGRVALLVQKIGPYHHARFCEAARTEALDVVEFRSDDPVYSWSTVKEQGGYRRHRANAGNLDTILDSLRPRVVVCVGYSDPEIHRAMAWALRRKTPMVTCADSTALDEPRRWWKERLKAGVIAGFDAALSAGSRSNCYLQALGMDPNRIFPAWDVVDNEHFEKGARAARSDSARERIRLGLPERYFLCVARFVPKKNLSCLIEGYMRYAAEAGPARWPLVISGSGPLEPELRAQITSANLTSAICLPGFLQYPDLPACYGLAGAFVLPSLSDQWGLVVNEAMAAGLPVIVSERCGCVPELVRPGENGFILDPEDSMSIATLLSRTAALSSEQLAAMGNRSRELIAEHTLSHFSSGLWIAVRAATEVRRSRNRLFPRIMVSLLAWLRSRRTGLV